MQLEIQLRVRVVTIMPALHPKTPRRGPAVHDPIADLNVNRGQFN